MFILLPGRSKAEAFAIGREIAATVTATNPPPVKLKFEKVYLPCILQTKKRYVGYAYEEEGQLKPIFDDKGIETVRRDGCPAVQKIMERCLRLLFEQRDLSRMKQYLSEQWLKILQDRINLADFIFAKEYRGRDSYSERACVAALEIANKLVRFDPRAEPRVRERVPYVIVCGPPKATLISLVRQPHELLLDPALRLNATYYIRKQIIPPLERCFNLMGINVAAWYEELPRVYRCSNAFAVGSLPAHGSTGAQGVAGHRRPPRGTIAQYYQSQHCIVCDTLTRGAFCPDCTAEPQRTILTLYERQSRVEAKHQVMLSICFRCTGAREADVACVSVDCPVYFERARLGHKLQGAISLHDLEF
jgi:DNA polymerase zeta